VLWIFFSKDHSLTFSPQSPTANICGSPAKTWLQKGARGITFPPFHLFPNQEACATAVASLTFMQLSIKFFLDQHQNFLIWIPWFFK
jgi:hypothetical protein